MAKNKKGWIPPDNRNQAQRAFCSSVLDIMGDFEERVTAYVELPDKVITPEWELKVNGGVLMPRIWQTSGSCVGAGAGNAYIQAIVGDIAVRGDMENLQHTFWLSSYGVGREIAGMRGRGSGSFGQAQAAACQSEAFGLIPDEHEKAMQPKTIKGKSGYHDWIQYKEQTEIEWSWPPKWPVSRDEFQEHAEKYGIQSVSRINTEEGLDQSLAQVFGVTMASMFGTRKATVQGDVLLAPYNGSWAHQMSIFAYWNHPTHGKIYAIQNQWGPTYHGICPTLGSLGLTGCFWIKGADMRKLLGKRDTEIFAHSATMGFPSQKVDWGGIWQYE